MAASLSTDPEQPRLWLRWLGTLALLVYLALLALHAFTAAGPRLPPALLGLGLVGTLGAVAANFAVGHLLFLLGLGIQLAYYWTHPTQLPAELALRANLLSLTCATQLFVVGYGRTVRLLGRRIRAQQLRIEQRLSERAELTRALNRDLSRSVEALRSELAAHQPALPALHAAHHELQQVMERARRTLDTGYEPALAVDTVLPDFRRRMTRILLGVSLCNVSLTIVRVTLTGKGPPLPTWIVLGLTIAVLVGSERHPRLRPQLIGVLTGATLLAIIAACFYWGFHEPPPNVLFLVTLAYNGFLIEARRAPWMVLALCLLVQAVLVYVGVSADVWSVGLMAWTGLWSVLHQLGWYALERRVFSALRTAQERAGELSLLDAFRARISGTLFHDVANPVQVIGMLLELAAARDALKPSELSTLLRFHQRLSALARATFELLEHGDLLAREHSIRTPLFGMFLELRELFQFRLAAKAQTLRTQTEERLCVVTVPELLRDSVLANLLSNAIKFSPQGSTIELSAERVGAEAEIVVRDQGPGWPSDLQRLLAQGQRPASTRGTAGEPGLGLGLSLATEHARRLGGSLTLRSPASGGAEVAVRVPAAAGAEA